jgi:hypothetical protein
MLLVPLSKVTYMRFAVVDTQGFTSAGHLATSLTTCGDKTLPGLMPTVYYYVISESKDWLFCKNSRHAPLNERTKVQSVEKKNPPPADGKDTEVSVAIGRDV